MAKFKPIHGEMSGSIGDNTWSHNKGGPYVRERRIPTNPNSIKQAAARVILSTLSGAWSTITPTQQTAWADYAVLNPFTDALGTSISLSGQQMFVALNARLLQAGAARADDPPVGTGPAGFSTLAITPTAPANLSLAFAPTPTGAAERIMLWSCLPATKGRNGNFNQARLVGFGPVADATPTVFVSPYPFAAGHQFNCYVQRLDGNGRVSPVQKVVVLVP